MVDTILTANDDIFSAPGGRADTINGIGGNDTINGNDRNDSILGGTGDDRLDGGSQNDTVRGEAGNDTIVNGSGGADLLDGGDDNDSITGGGQAETMLGGAGNDILVGNSGNNSIEGGTGNDSIVGGSNNEILRGGDDADTILSNGGTDLLEGGGGNDSLVGGGSGLETLSGGEGNDVLVANGDTALMFGGGGDDSFRGLTGNYGDKYVSGGGGADVAVFGGNYNPANFVQQSGTFQGQPYQAYYQIPNSYRVYFNDFRGALEFDNQDVAVDVPCFAEGTMIMAAGGECAVETLRAGDLVVTASGQGAVMKPVRWVGRREVNLDTHPRRQDVAPILVLPGALGAGTPHRPLRVSPDHAVLVDGMLVPAGLLVDNETILRLPARGRVTWFHVELDAHDLLLSDGAVTESYLDMGNRQAFANAGSLTQLHADFTATDPATPGCRPRVTGGPDLDRARATLVRRRVRAVG
jgi:Ca2+-binding RTX toxin-like protein